MEMKNSFIREVADRKYEYGFETDVHTEVLDKGLSEDVVGLISEKKGLKVSMFMLIWIIGINRKLKKHLQTLRRL